MSLRERLAGLGYPSARTTETTASAPVIHHHDVEHVVGDTAALVDDGPCVVTRRRVHLGEPRGGEPLSAFRTVAPAALALVGRDDRLGAIDPERTVFLDVETTGLAGGTGTYAFLVGIAYVDGDHVELRQFFMRDYAAERALLVALEERLDPFTAVVSFNGKSFDLPLLQTRYTYAQVSSSLARALHLDLLHPARRVWRHRLESCSLGTLEAAVLAHDRGPDIPGWLIPQAYFDYLHSRDARPLLPIFRHNQDDLLTLIALTTRLGRYFADPLAAGPDHAADWFGLARAFEDAERLDSATLCFEQALARAGQTGDGISRSTVLERLALVYKRQRSVDQAVVLWETLVRTDARSPFPYIELAKHREHRLRDYTGALDLAERAAAVLAANRQAFSNLRYQVEQADLDKRAARLRRKLVRESAPPVRAG